MRGRVVSTLGHADPGYSDPELYFDMKPQVIAEQVAALTEALRSGIPRLRAVRAAGLGKREYAAMVRLARDGEEPYVSLLAGFEEAEAEGEAQLVADIGASGDWRAKAWLLERTRSEVYGQRVQVDVTKELERVFGILEKALPAQTFTRILDELALSDSGVGGEGVASASSKRGAGLN